MRTPPYSPNDSFTAALSDGELLARLRESDEGALETIMRTHAPQMGAIAYALLGRSDLAKDVVQEVFVALWEQRATLDIQHSLRGYLARAVRNRSLNVVRHERHHETFSDFDTGLDTSVLATACNAGERNVELGDFNTRFLELLQSVPPQPRRAFLLSWHGGLSYPEIAELLGVTLPTVYQLMYRATRRLATILPANMFP